MSAEENDEIDELRVIVHDLKNCLHAIGMGVQLLPEVRGDDAQFTEICESMDNDCKEADKLVRRLVEVRQARDA